MKTFEISNKTTGISLGRYQGTTSAEALDACARDAGYRDWAAACAACETAPDDGEIVTREVESLTEADRTVYVRTGRAEIKILDGYLKVFRGEWHDAGEPNTSQKAAAARSFYNAALSAEDRGDDERATAYLTEMVRYGGLPWHEIAIVDDDGNTIVGVAKERVLREYRDTGVMSGHRPVGLSVAQINWSGL